jgi:hypothetical protein
VVVLDEPPPQPARFDAHKWIGLRVERRGLLEHLDGDCVALQTIAASSERLLDDEPQELAGAAGLLENAASENALERSSTFFWARLRGRGIRRFWGRHCPIPSRRQE